MASVNYFLPNELDQMIHMKEEEEEKELRVNYVKQPKKLAKMISIKHRELSQPLEKMTSSMTLNDDEEDEEEEDEEWLDYKRRCRASNSFLELELLDGAIATPFDIIHPQETRPVAPVLASFVTKEGYIDHSHVAACAVHELSALALDSDGFLWTKSPVDGTTDILDIQHYQQTFPRPKPPSKRKRTSSSSWTRTSRASAIVKMEPTRLVQKLTNDDKWKKLFPSIVTTATGLRFLRKGSSRHNPDGSLQIIYTELQAPTPLLPKRRFTFLRTCKQIDQSTWVVADISVDRSRNVGFPQGCLIQGLGGGVSEVIWVEHLEFEENRLNQKLYTDLTSIGFGYGAQRWAACLEQSCERKYYRDATDILVPGLLGKDDPWQFEKKYVMKLSHRMISTFCWNLSFHDIRQQPLSYVPGPTKVNFYTDIRKNLDSDNPNDMLIVSAITFSLVYSPEFVLQVLGDEHRRHEWDVTGKISRLTKPTFYKTGSDFRNKISVYQTDSGNEVVLQETSVNRSGSLLVWSLLKSDEFDRIRNGKFCAWVPSLIGLSGLAISSNSQQNTTTRGGSFVTLGVQQEVRDIKGLDPKTKEFAMTYMMGAASRVLAVLHKSQGDLLLKESAVQLKTSKTGDCLN